MSNTRHPRHKSTQRYTRGGVHALNYQEGEQASQMRRTRSVRTCVDCRLVMIHAKDAVKLSKYWPTLAEHFARFRPDVDFSDADASHQSEQHMESCEQHVQFTPERTRGKINRTQTLARVINDNSNSVQAVEETPQVTEQLLRQILKRLDSLESRLK